MENSLKRRLLLKGAISLAALFSLNRLMAIEQIFQEGLPGKQFFINPAYSIVQTSDGTIFLETKMPDGRSKKIGFKDVMYGDILILIAEKKQPSDYIPQLASKYHLPNQNCQVKCDSILAVLEKEYLIVSEETKISIKKNEVNKGKQ